MGSHPCRSCMACPVEPWNSTNNGLESTVVPIPLVSPELLRNTDVDPQSGWRATFLCPTHSAYAQETENRNVLLETQSFPGPVTTPGVPGRVGRTGNVAHTQSWLRLSIRHGLTILRGQRHRVCVKIGHYGIVDLRHMAGLW